MLILTASCKSYSDAWQPFGILFERFWPDCPYRRVLFSEPPEQADRKMPGFEFLPRPDVGWILNLREILREFQDRAVMVFQEDFFLCYPVHTATVLRLQKWFEKSQYDCCRLFPCPGADDEKEITEGVGEITAAAPYRVSCQLAFWKREKLIELCSRLLNAGHTRIQQFETSGSNLIDDFKLCGWIRRGHPQEWPICYHCSAIANGKWMQGAVQFCAEQGIALSKRDIIFADDAQQAILRESYYEWLTQCACGPMKPVKLKS